MKLYGHPFSTCTRKVLMTCAEKGFTPEFITVNMTNGEHKSEAHLARQPFGVVPVLEDEGFSLYESRAIMRYLDARSSTNSLTPTNIREKALMDQWLSVEPSYFSSPAMTIIKQAYFGTMMGKTPDQEMITKARNDLTCPLDVLDRALNGHDYLVGNQFTLADITYMPYVQYLFASECGDLITQRKSMNAWWNRVSTRPTWQQVISKKS